MDLVKRRGNRAGMCVRSSSAFSSSVMHAVFAMCCACLVSTRTASCHNRAVAHELEAHVLATFAGCLGGRIEKTSTGKGSPQQKKRPCLHETTVDLEHCRGSETRHLIKQIKQQSESFLRSRWDSECWMHTHTWLGGDW